MIKLRVIDFQYCDNQESFILENNNKDKNEKYFLPFDDNLIKLLGVKRKNQRQEVLTPRDIQALLRSGKNSKKIAAEYGISYDWVQKFEPPIIAERNFISYRAKSILVFRNGADGSRNFSLNDIVSYSIQDYKENGKEVKLDWDAVHLSTNTWLISVSIDLKVREGVVDTKKANWSFNTKNTKIIPRNNEALELMSNFERSNKNEENSKNNYQNSIFKEKKDDALSNENAKLKFFNKNKQNYLLNKSRKGGDQDNIARVPEWDEVLFGDYL